MHIVASASLTLQRPLPGLDAVRVRLGGESGLEIDAADARDPHRVAATALGLQAGRGALAQGRRGRKRAAASPLHPLRQLSAHQESPEHGRGAGAPCAPLFFGVSHLEGTTHRTWHQPTLTCHIPGSWGCTATTTAESGMLSSSFRSRPFSSTFPAGRSKALGRAPWCFPSPCSRPGALHHAPLAAGGKQGPGGSPTNAPPKASPLCLLLPGAPTCRVPDLDLRGRAAQGHGDLLQAGVEGDGPRVLPPVLMVRRQQVDFGGLDGLFHPLQYLGAGGGGLTWILAVWHHHFRAVSEAGLYGRGTKPQAHPSRCKGNRVIWCDCNSQVAPAPPWGAATSSGSPMGTETSCAWFKADTGLPEQPRGALGTRIDPRGIQGLGQTTSLSLLTSFTCCLSRWKTCPELVAAMRSYTRYPGWLLSPQSPVSTNTTCKYHIGVPCSVPLGTAHPGGQHTPGGHIQPPAR